ncbi:hypothetical protein DCAR_0622750 [Daucus carota subsp. sativus]|uniref:Uncharacterized protein n=1 Tax=Daucus carota subsp. sativus TaxID=79200 RepID=A0A164UU99_DAUCS|nr:hypothetical protein DCAR_0622750 [Daucus carota subsp. sativus]
MRTRTGFNKLSGITPFVNLNHYDVPQALQERYSGLLSREIVKYFVDYAEFCFQMCMETGLKIGLHLMNLEWLLFKDLMKVLSHQEDALSSSNAFMLSASKPHSN